MQALGNMEILEILERGDSRSHPERALVMLAAGYPDQAQDSLLRLSLGERDAACSRSAAAPSAAGSMESLSAPPANRI